MNMAQALNSPTYEATQGTIQLEINVLKIKKNEIMENNVISTEVWA